MKSDYCNPFLVNALLAMSFVSPKSLLIIFLFADVLQLIHDSNTRDTLEIYAVSGNVRTKGADLLAEAERNKSSHQIERGSDARMGEGDLTKNG
jgi:hypothetical protein